jgi:hypothetical protein
MEWKFIKAEDFNLKPELFGLKAIQVCKVKFYDCVKDNNIQSKKWQYYVNLVEEKCPITGDKLNGYEPIWYLFAAKGSINTDPPIIPF